MIADWKKRLVGVPIIGRPLLLLYVVAFAIPVYLIWCMADALRYGWKELANEIRKAIR